MLKVKINSIILNDSEKRNLLRNVSFELEPNSIYAVLGRNGAGKTTLAKSLTSLLPGEYSLEGKVFYRDQNLLEMQKSELRLIRKSKIKYVFQDPVNSFDPLKKMLYYFKPFVKKSGTVDQLFERFNLGPKEKIFSKHSYELSTGMAQRVSLVLACLAEPEILILDEPTSAVDAIHVNLLSDFLKEFISQKNNIVLMITQDINLARAASDYIAVIENGELTNFKPAAEYENLMVSDGK